ncbi:MAG: TPM domain-containing protein [Xanthomonadaceae bacterium]|nr:TPM domain-containing protein [Xanthomonadaceae bacterium]
MPRRILLLCWLWLCVMPAVWAQSLAPIPRLDSPVIDTTGTLSVGQKTQLEQQSLDLQRRKGSQLQILIVPTAQPEDIAQYTQRVFDGWKIGRKGIDDGVLLVVAKDDQRVRIQTGYGLEGAIPDITANRVIQEYLVPKFRENDYAGGIAAASKTLVNLIDGESLPPPMAAKERFGDTARSVLETLIASCFILLFFSFLIPLRIRMVFFGVVGFVVFGIIGPGVPKGVSIAVAVAGAIIGVVAALLVELYRIFGGSRWQGGDRGGGRSSGGGGGWSNGGGGGWSGGGGGSGGGGASGRW